MDYNEKLQEILKKKDQQYSEDRINLSVLGEEINDVEYLIKNGLNEKTAKEIFWSSTSSSLFELLIDYLAGPYSDDISRCKNETCPERVHCIRFFLGNSKKTGVYSYSEFVYKDGCEHKIEV